MEKIINIHIEKLPEGLYLATSDEVQGLVAQGRTITETLEIARDVAKKLIEAQEDKSNNFSNITVDKNEFDLPLVIGI
jgi:predicted RNase H-like HicB family nuclease